MSKENNILELFFNESSKHWHFEDIVRTSKVSRDKTNKWLIRFKKEGLIKKIKKRGRMSYYIADFENSAYKNKKRIFALNRLYQSNLLNHLYSLKKAKTVIIFGSFSRSDWYTGSDIDIFIYGDPEGLKIVDYELKLHRNIQLFICQNKEELTKLGPGLIRNIIKGNLIKGDINFITVSINA